jgi:hypothetical protein
MVLRLDVVMDFGALIALEWSFWEVGLPALGVGCEASK